MESLREGMVVAESELAWRRGCAEQIRDRWPGFVAARQAHLRSHEAGRTPAERAAVNILCQLFTGVLDWSAEQVGRRQDQAGILLTRLGVRYLVVEAERPGSLAGPGSIGRALGHARRYAEEVSVGTIAVSDGCVLEAHDLDSLAGVLRPRLRVQLSDPDPPGMLCWLSTQGIYRRPHPVDPAPEAPEAPGWGAP